MKLIKIDRNGSKHFEGIIDCDRCGGTGVYAHHIENGKVVPTWVDNGICHKCNGAGKVHAKWIERTPEYEAKLAQRRQAKWEAEVAKMEAERKAQEELERREREEAERKAREEKKISKHFGEVGQKVELTLTFHHTAWWKQKAYNGYGMETMYAHTWKDEAGNVFVWKTSSFIGNHEEGEKMTVKATIKEHSEYDGEKQTILTRCRIS